MSSLEFYVIIASVLGITQFKPVYLEAKSTLICVLREALWACLSDSWRLTHITFVTEQLDKTVKYCANLIRYKTCCIAMFETNVVL
jgi:hypothetical protein